jgi:hypothetical protein
VRRMQEAGISVIFTHNGEVIAKIDQKTIMIGKRMNELYVLYITVQNALSIQTNGQATITRLENKDKLWLERLGHISTTKFAHLKAKVLVEDSNYLNYINPLDSLCESCCSMSKCHYSFDRCRRPKRSYYCSRDNQIAAQRPRASKITHGT